MGWEQWGTEEEREKFSWRCPERWVERQRQANNRKAASDIGSTVSNLVTLRERWHEGEG